MPRGEVHDALAGAGNADHPGIFVSARVAVGHQIRRADGRRLLRRDVEIVGCAFDERADFCLFEHQASDSSSSNASFN